jgi:hypothetical protein
VSSENKAAERVRRKHLARIGEIRDERRRFFYAWSWVLSIVRRNPTVLDRATARVLSLADDLHEEAYR